MSLIYFLCTAEPYLNLDVLSLISCSISFRGKEDKLPPLVSLVLPGSENVRIWTLKLSDLVIELVTNLRNNSNSVLTSPQNADFDSLHVLSMLLPAVFESYELNIWLHKEYDFPDTQYTFAQEIGDDENSNLSVWFRGEQSKLRNLVDHLKRVDRKNDIRRQLPMLETRLSTCDYFAKFFIWQVSTLSRLDHPDPH